MAVKIYEEKLIEVNSSKKDNKNITNVLRLPKIKNVLPKICSKLPSINICEIDNLILV